MAYCVNCGVKLTPPETVCPLCNVEMFNPKEPPSEQKSRYSTEMERIGGDGKRFFAAVISFILLVPAAICLLLNILVYNGSQWSIFAIGGMALIFLFFLFPPLVAKKCPLAYICVDTVAVAVFLLMVTVFFTPGDWRWFLILGLPLTIAAGGAVSLLVFLSRFSYFKPLLRMIAYALILIAVYTVGVEMLILGFSGAVCVPIWSWIPFAACVLTAAFCLFLNRSRRWQEEVHKRFFL